MKPKTEGEPKHVLLLRAGQPAPDFKYQTLECSDISDAERELHKVSYCETRMPGEPVSVFKHKDIKIGLLKAANGEYIWFTPVGPPVAVKELCSNCRKKICKTYVERDYKVTA